MADAQTSSWTRPILLIALLVPLGLFFLLYLGTEQQFEGVPHEYHISGGDTVYHTLPAFSMLRIGGDTITEKDFAGRIVMLSFFSVDDDDDLKTTVLLGNLQRSYDNVDWDRDPPFLFVSINTGDSLAAVKAYQEEVEADPAHWWLLHGAQEQVLAIADDAFRMKDFAGKQPGFTPFTSQFSGLIDKEGRLRKLYEATDLQEERNIQEDLIALLRLEYPEDIALMRD